jgi:ATP-dependent DNA helicase RecG
LATLSSIAHGIDPADGRITGSRPRHSGEKTDTYRVSALIANRTRPSLACRVEIVEMDGLTVLAIEIPTSRTPVSTPEGKYQRRAIGGKGKPK